MIDYEQLIDDLSKVVVGPEWATASSWMDSLSVEVPARQRAKNYWAAKRWFEAVGRRWVFAS